MRPVSKVSGTYNDGLSPTKNLFFFGGGGRGGGGNSCHGRYMKKSKRQ